MKARLKREIAATTYDNGLHDLVRYQAECQPHAAAIFWQSERISYGELYRRIERLAGALASSYQAGDRIGVLAWNCPAFIELLYAAPAAGQILVPLNTRLSPFEWRAQIERAELRALVVEPELLNRLEPSQIRLDQFEIIQIETSWPASLNDRASGTLPELSGDETAWLLFTSGSTGQPKGALLSHRSLRAALVSATGARPVQRTDRYLYPFPLFHVAAHNVLLQHAHGAAVVLMRSFDAGEVIELCQRIGVTSMSLAPTMIGRLLDHPHFDPASLASVRSIGYGASAIPAPLLRRVLSELPVGLSQGYGMTELSGNVAFLDQAAHRRANTEAPELLRSVGRPVATVDIYLARADGTKAAAGEPGEVLVRGDQIMVGYWRDPEATASTLVDGWLHTGDIGQLDAAGNLYIVDRKKDMIVSGGENVASREVENALHNHPLVEQVAVVGIPDADWGETVCAAVQLRPGKRVEPEALIAHCRQQLAAYKSPKHIRFIENLPLNASGKIDKQQIRRLFTNLSESVCS